jgi:hypothetical protein
MDHTEAAPQERPGVGFDEQALEGSTMRDAQGLDAPELDSPGLDGQEPDQEQALEDEPAPDHPEPPRTGDPAVDEVIDAVARAVRGPLEVQLAAYETAHRTLQARLADVEG